MAQLVRASHATALILVVITLVSIAIDSGVHTLVNRLARCCVPLELTALCAVFLIAVFKPARWADLEELRHNNAVTFSEADVIDFEGVALASQSAFVSNIIV